MNGCPCFTVLWWIKVKTLCLFEVQYVNIIVIYTIMHCSFDILHLWCQHMCGNRFWHTYAMHSILPLKSGVTQIQCQTFRLRMRHSASLRPRAQLLLLMMMMMMMMTTTTLGSRHRPLCLLAHMITRQGVPVLPLLPLLHWPCSGYDTPVPYTAAGSSGSRAGSTGNGPAADVWADAIFVSDDSGPSGHSAAATFSRQGWASGFHDSHSSAYGVQLPPIQFAPPPALQATVVPAI
jgi:hypothetical protein